MPQTLSEPWRQQLGPQAERVHADYLHRPGNLTLSAYNQQLWNHPFDIKRDRYAQSNIVLTRELANHESWGEDAINNRGRQLASEASRIWTGPQDPVVRTAPQDDEDSLGRRELRMQFWTGLNEYLAAEYPDLPQVEARPSWTLRLPSGVRHVGFELRLGLRQGTVGIDIWFCRAASRPIWDRICTAPDAYDALIGANWNFEPIEGSQRARMFLDRPAQDLRDDSTWPDLYTWFGAKVTLLYAHIAPKLREELDRVGAPPATSW